MGGEIGVESAPGVGSLFWFEVPLEPGDPAAAEAAGDGGPGAVPARPLRLLAAEDVAINRDLLREMLGRHGHELTFAADGAEAVELASRGRFDLVLMDVQMPVMDGLEATRRIRALPPPAGRVPIVRLTASVAPDERRLCLEAGMDRVLGKPVDWPGLLATLAALAGPGEPGGAAPRWCPEAGPVAEPERAGAAEAPLLDRGMLDRLGATLPAEAFAGFVRRGIENAERACARLPTLPAGSEEQVREAHSLKGTAGSFGLRRVSAVAAEIEAAAREGGDVSGLVGRLAAAVAETREALREAGLLPDRV
jgi:CheY-like chemotaxis protein